MSKTTKDWFTASKAGLAKLVRQRGMGPLVAELVQNAWDEDDVSQVQVNIEPLPGLPKARLRVEDDAPNGFKDLGDVYTLFAESYKKTDAEKRGQFNLGEKLLLSVCEWAEVVST